MTETRGTKQKASSNGKAASTAGKPAAPAGEASETATTVPGGSDRPAGRSGKTGPAKAAGLRITRRNTTPGVHPYDQVTWESRDVVMTNWRDGSINFEQR